MASPVPELDEFLRPLRVDAKLVHQLSREFGANFQQLAAESTDQFLATPISESVLRPRAGKSTAGKYLAIDIGGTNLRVGFIELNPRTDAAADSHAVPDGVHAGAADGIHAGAAAEVPRLRRLHERSWPILAHLKHENAENLFVWIGGCIASVVREGCASFSLARDAPLPMGVTFSFPMEQDSLSDARLMAMGKGFAITSKLDLGSQLLKGYEKARSGGLPDIRIAAIANDAVSTLVSVMYEFDAGAGGRQKPVMSLICGTGCNATLAMKLSSLRPSKRPARVNVLPGQGGNDVRIAVNTEWTINGTAPPMRKLGLISRWDDQLSQSVELPGFQPLEYMTAGRYLGELGRIMLADYMTSVAKLGEKDTFPSKVLNKFDPHNTTFLSHYRPGGEHSLLSMLNRQFPVETADDPAFRWTEDIAEALYHIARAIEVRAAGIIAAATVGLLRCAGELPLPPGQARPEHGRLELVVGYTGGCITNFQDYLSDCQQFLDAIVELEHGADAPVRVVLRPCHDGGIKGAGILVPAALNSKRREN